MLRVRDDDATAFEDLVTRYQDRLVRIIEHLAPNRDMAEDLVQEVFFRVYRARKRYTADAKFSTWLFTIANNVVHNAYRSHSRRHEVNVGDKPPSSNGSGRMNVITSAAAPSGQMPARQLEGLERAELVRLAIQSLSERQRTALLLSRFEEMSHQDIADTMGLSSKAVKSLLSRARVNLRDILAPYFDDGRSPGSKSNDSEPESGEE